jgi:adenine-specific DNA-methyltransferase
LTGVSSGKLPTAAAPGASRIRYIGSKARLAVDILRIVGPPGPDSTFVDLFAGTGVVSRHAAVAGWTVRANDHLVSSAIVTHAQLLSASDVPFSAVGGYGRAIEKLNAADAFHGFVHQEYAPSGLSRSGDQRLYFTPENAARIDGMRRRIEEWHTGGALTRNERALLIADLLGAANAVANTAGTYGCFLREWSGTALRRIRLTRRRLLDRPCRFEVSTRDAFEVMTLPADIVYLDPPYTKRQYAAYYHLMETVAAGDCPEVEGVTGLRPWQAKHSPFCYKTRALGALDRLIQGIQARRIVMSYSSEGHVSLESMKEMLARHGAFTVTSIPDIGRYRPNRRASAAASQVTEYVLDLARKG